MRVGIVVNHRHASGMRAGHRLGTLLTDRGVRWKSMTTTVHEPGALQARALVAWGAEALVVIGGDGTVRAVAPEVATAPGVAEVRTVPVLVVPTGSATVLARHLGIRSPHAAIGLMSDAADRFASTGQIETNELTVPLNHAELVTADGRRVAGRFLLMAGMGGDAEAVARKLPLPGPAGYVCGAARALAARTLVRPTIVDPDDGDSGLVDPLIGGDERDGRGTWAVMASTVARPAGPIAVFPEARLGQPGFECLRVSMPEPGRSLRRLSAWTRIAAAAVTGHPDDAAGMDYWTSGRLRVMVDEPARVHLDGDDIGPCTEITLRAGTERVAFIAP